MAYKMTNAERDTLKRFNDAFLMFGDAARFFEMKMSAYVRDAILPKLGIKAVPGVTTPINVKWDTGEVEVGIAKPNKGLLVPKGNGEHNT